MNAELLRRFNAAPWYRHVGLEATSPEPGRSEVRLPFRAELTQVYGSVHGGALMTLADSAIGVAVASTLADDEAVATVEMSIQFLDAPGERDVVAHGRLNRRGKTLGFAEAVLRAGDTEVARAQGICHIRKR